MANYWAMRTDRDAQEFFWSELKQGRLRQGWGYEDWCDLQRLRTTKEKRPLKDYENQVWRGNRRLLADEPDGIRAGDVILVPHLPRRRFWSIVRVVDDTYRYEIDPEYSDYGHIRNVTLLTDDVGVHPYNKFVGARLRGSMRCRLRLWSLAAYESQVEQLLAACDNGDDLSGLVTGQERLIDVHEKTRARLWEALSSSFRGEEFEEPVELLLKRLYPDGDVQHKGGRGEHGADFICTFTDPFDVAYRVAIQVKMHEGKGSLVDGLNQLRIAKDNYDQIAAGLLLTTLDDVDEATERKREEIETELGMPIHIIMREETLDLFMAYLPDIAAGFADAP